MLRDSRYWRHGTFRCRPARQSPGTSRWSVQGISFAGFRSSRAGRFVTHNVLRALEALRIAPKGTIRVSETLNLCAAAMAQAGRLGIFSPMYLIHARKPER